MEKCKYLPLPKTKLIQDISKDLRPIFLTHMLAKMLEQYPVNHMRETCQNVNSSQFGAVKGSSTTFALLEILHPIYKATDDHQNYARILLIDFSKAFDHIDHNILLNKLNINGVHPTIQRWYHNFLQDKQQRVKIN